MIKYQAALTGFSELTHRQFYPTALDQGGKHLPMTTLKDEH